MTSERTNRDRAEIPRETLELDYVYEILAAPRRRYACYAVTEAGAEQSLAELATAVAALEKGVPEDEMTDIKHIYVSLSHVHLPKLVDERVLTFDPDTERIGAGQRIDQVLNALEGMAAGLD